MAVISTSLTNNEYGLKAQGLGGGTAVITISSSLVSGNANVGLQSGTGSTLESLGNNTIRQNVNGVTGTMTTVPTS